MEPAEAGTTVMEEAFRKAEAGKDTPKKGGKGTLNVDEAAERLKKMMDLFASKRDAESISEEKRDELTSMAEFAATNLRSISFEIAEINAAVKNGIPVDAGRLPELQKQSAELRQCYDALTKTHSWLLSELTKRAGKRQRVSEFVGKIARFKVGETKFNDIRQLADEAIQSGIITQATDGHVTLGFGERAVSYGPADDSPETVEFVSELAEFIGKFNEEGQRRREALNAEVDDFLIIGENLEEAKEHATKSLPDFVRGTGNIIFIPAEWKNQTGQSGFLGEVMVLRKNNGMVATKATTQQAAHKIFGHVVNRGEADEKWVAHGEQEVLFVTDDDGVQFDPTRNPTLRYALQAKFVKDTAYKERREASERLRDVSSVDTAITMAELLRGEAGTCIVNVLLKKDRDDKGLWVTLHLVSDGEQARISVYEPEDLVQKLPWLKDYKEPKPVEVFSNDRRWQKVAESNRDHFEANWSLDREAEKRGAVKLSKENVEDICSIKGGDGLYALTRATSGFDRTPLRVIMQKKDDMVAVVWLAPGASTRALANRSGKSLIGEFLPMNDLPKAVRSILRNQYRFFLGLGGDAGLEKVPGHLKEEKSPDAEEDGADD